MGSGDFCAGLLDLVVGGEGLVEGEADCLDGDVWVAGLFEEGAEDAGGDVAAAADGDHEVGFEVGEDAVGGILAEFVHLENVVLGLDAGMRGVAADLVVGDVKFFDHVGGVELSLIVRRFNIDVVMCYVPPGEKKEEAKDARRRVNEQFRYSASSDPCSASR